MQGILVELCRWFGNYVSRELVANSVTIVCTNPGLKTPTVIWIPNLRVTTGDWWVKPKKLELISDSMQIFLEDMFGFGDERKGHKSCLLWEVIHKRLGTLSRLSVGQYTRLVMVRQYDTVMTTLGRLRTDTIVYGQTVSTLGGTQIIDLWVAVVILPRAIQGMGLDAVRSTSLVWSVHDIPTGWNTSLRALILYLWDVLYKIGLGGECGA